MLKQITQPPYIPPPAVDYRRAEARLAALPEYERAAVEGMIAELVGLHGVGRMCALEIVVKVGWWWRQTNDNS